MRRVLLGLVALAAASSLNAAEVKLPQASPAATLSQAIGISNVAITYHRPAVKDRKIWGALVPFGEVWRLGANDATTIEISDPMKIAGRNVGAGKYSLFAIPGEKEWTLILNSRPNQWGSYFYDAKLDVIRFTVVPETAPFVERMELSVNPVSDSKAIAEMRWEKLRIAFPIEVDTKQIVWKQIDNAISAAKPEEWEVFHNAARYSLETGERRSEAYKWIDAAMTHDSFWNYELKGRLLHSDGKTADALPLMKKAIETSKGKAPDGYWKNLELEIAKWTDKK